MAIAPRERRALLCREYDLDQEGFGIPRRWGRKKRGFSFPWDRVKQSCGGDWNIALRRLQNGMHRRSFADASAPNSASQVRRTGRASCDWIRATNRSLICMKSFGGNMP